MPVEPCGSGPKRHLSKKDCASGGTIAPTSSTSVCASCWHTLWSNLHATGSSSLSEAHRVGSAVVQVCTRATAMTITYQRQAANRRRRHYDYSDYHRSAQTWITHHKSVPWSALMRSRTIGILVCSLHAPQPARIKHHQRACAHHGASVHNAPQCWNRDRTCVPVLAAAALVARALHRLWP